MNFSKNYRIVLCCCLGVLLGNTIVNAQNAVPDATERAALMAIYNSTDGANWTAGKKWTVGRINSYPNVDSTLYGVEMAAGDVVSINLSVAGLNGELPADLSDLSALQSLNLGYNNLNGSLPDLGNLTSLTNLDLSANNFTGTLPVWLGSLTELQNLSLSSNQSRTGKLNGPVPTSISQLVNLRSLNLSYCGLSMIDAIPSAFTALDNLQTLDLSGSGLTPLSVPNGISGLAGLTYLNLNSVPSILDDGAFPDILIDLPNLRTLTIESDGVQSLPLGLTELNQLNYIDLTNNNFSDTSVLHTVIDTLAHCPALKTIVLNSCSITALPENLRSLASVESLFLGYNNLSPSQCQSLGQMPALKNLYLYFCDLADLPTGLANSPTLELLNVMDNNLYPVPHVVSEIDHLKSLDLTNNGIESLPTWFGGGDMGGVTSLTLANNPVPLPLPDNFQSMTNLTYLNLSNCNLEGALPAYFSSFTQIKYLDLSFNKLTSPLPDFSNWTSLNNVFLQHNNLTGAVPASLSNQTVRKYQVDLSFNHWQELPNYNSDVLLSIKVNNNQLDFENILKVSRPVQTYIYIPQDTLRASAQLPPTVTIYPGDSLILTSGISPNIASPSQVQWFKYVDGINDIPVTQPSSSDYTLVVSPTSDTEGGKYYFKVTNSSVPGLTLTGEVQTVVISPCRTNAMVDFTGTRFVCAMAFEPAKDSKQCSGITYHWDFGDGSSSDERNPVHKYEPGTYSVSLHVTYLCGPVCQTDSVAQKQITFDGTVADTQLFKDSVIQVTTNVRDQVLSTAASTFSDAWAMPNTPSTQDGQNPFLAGTLGVWRNEGTYVYNVPRTQSANLKTSVDGSFSMEDFDWGMAAFDMVPNWLKSNTISLYSPYSYELENIDPLGVHSAALYDYHGQLVTASGANMKNKEMGFTSFESDLTAGTGNFHFVDNSLPAYSVYNVELGQGRMAVVRAPLGQFDNVASVDVTAGSLFPKFKRYFYSVNAEIICRQLYPKNPDWTVIVLGTEPVSGLWSGQIKIKNQLLPTAAPVIDKTYAHSGEASLSVTSNTTFDQKLLQLDSGKAYVINAWVSVKNPQALTPIPVANLGIDVIIKNVNGDIISTTSILPTGNIVEGWQQVKGSFLCSAANSSLSLGFKSGEGSAWYDDLRIHPSDGNMKSYVYSTVDYKLRAVLDEENFASFYYYDQEGNLFLVKKETERGVKTISENINYQIEH